MHKNLLIIISILFAGCVSTGNYVAVKASHSGDELSQCSRSSPIAEGFWKPSKKIIQQLENDLPKLEELGSSGWGGLEKIDKPMSSYFRQYIGIYSNGNKKIYINAYHVSVGRLYRSPLIVCDGGKNFWGATYDPETHEFSDLAFNGEA